MLEQLLLPGTVSSHLNVAFINAFLIIQCIVGQRKKKKVVMLERTDCIGMIT